MNVRVRRGGRTESNHRVRFAITDTTGALLAHGGDVEAGIFPRSAIKPLQALPLVETGAADRFTLGDAELALASASHSGQARHAGGVAEWLERIGCTVGDLLCGAHDPYDRPAAEALRRSGDEASALHNNCSGKHAGMLTVARHLAVPTAGYLAADHPVQQRIARALMDMASLDRLPAPGIDGCGVPTWPMPLRAIATAAARFGSPDGLDDARREACRRLARAMRAHPLLVAGDGRPCSRIMAAIDHVVVKTGAEGVYLAALPDRGLGLALKVEDGSARAAVPALLTLLRALSVAVPATLDDLARPTLVNRGGTVVGRVEAELPENMHGQPIGP